MIVSDLELHKARDAFARAFRGRYATFDDDAPAEVRLLVRLLSAVPLPGLYLVVVLTIAQPTATPPMPATEVERFSVLASHASRFARFEHTFVISAACDIHVAFLSSVYRDGELVEEPVAATDLRLADVADSEKELKDVELCRRDGGEEGESGVVHAQFALEWLKMVSAQLVLEVRVEIEKNGGWPFSSTRPFYVLYRWEQNDSIWTPLYRSEVLSRESDHPDAKGSMIYQMAELFLNRVNNGVDDCALRLEFFHYKTTEAPKLLGHLSTSLRKLRQTKEGGTFDLHLNTFPDGELIGDVTMHASRITANRHFFGLQAHFGGDVKGDFVYFDLSVTEKKTGSWKKLRPKRPFFTISRYSDRGKWENIYRSEAAPRTLGGGPYKYKIAKFSERRLNGGQHTRPLSIMFYYEKVGSDPVAVGRIETTVATLLETKAGEVFSLETPEGDSNGYVRLEQSEEGASRLYFAAHFFPGTNSTEERPLEALVDSR